MTVHMKPGQWDFFWDWHLASPDLTLADMLRMIREQEEAKEAAAAAEEAEETEAWILQQEGAAEEAEEDATADPRVAVADRLEAAAKEAEAMVADLEDRACEMRTAARAYREMSERLRLQMAAPAPAEEPQQTWMERFKEQKRWGDMWYDQGNSITPVTSHRD